MTKCWCNGFLHGLPVIDCGVPAFLRRDQSAHGAEYALVAQDRNELRHGSAMANNHSLLALLNPLEQL